MQLDQISVSHSASHLMSPTACLPKSSQDEAPCYLHKISENLDNVPKHYKGIGIMD